MPSIIVRTYFLPGVRQCQTWRNQPLLTVETLSRPDHLLIMLNQAGMPLRLLAIIPKVYWSLADLAFHFKFT